jgi:hypothetical protein
MIAEDRNKTGWFTPESQKKFPENEQASFKLRALTLAEELAIRDHTYDERGRMLFGSKINMTVRAGLVGWKNVTDKDGKPIAFKTESGAEGRVYASDESMECLSEILCIEISTAIAERNMIDGNDLKN